MILAKHSLRRHIPRRPRHQIIIVHTPRRILKRDPKIRQIKESPLVKNKVLRLEISVNYFCAMTGVQGLRYACNEELGAFWLKRLLLQQVEAKVAAFE